MTGEPAAPLEPSPPPPPRPQYLAIPQSRPVWTYVLLAVNIVLWVGPGFLLAGTPLGDLVFTLGIKDNAAIAQGEYWRLLTSMFLHGSLLHVASNMLALYVLGPQVEAPFGPRRFLAVYFLSGLLASTFSFVISPSLSLGSSGAIFGLLGALIAFLVRNRRGFGAFGRQRLLNLLGVLALNVVISVGVPNIDLWAHAGGLLGGLALGAALTPVYRVERQGLWEFPAVVDASSPVVRALGTAAVTIGMIVLIAVGTLLNMG